MLLELAIAIDELALVIGDLLGLSAQVAHSSFGLVDSARLLASHLIVSLAPGFDYPVPMMTYLMKIKTTLSCQNVFLIPSYLVARKYPLEGTLRAQLVTIR